MSKMHKDHKATPWISNIRSGKETPELYFRPIISHANLNKTKYLIYQCAGMCGGLGDRFRGMVNSFLLALITGRKFGIDHTSPCPLQNFLRPNKYDWIIDKQKLDKAGSSKTHHLIDHQTLPSPNMTSYLKEDVVYLRMNGDITLRLMEQVDFPNRIPWLTKFTVSDLFESVLSYLFILTQSLQKGLDKFRNEHVKGNKTVCVHYRAGKNPTIPNDAPRWGDKYLNEVWNFLSKYNKSGHVIYIASDSEQVKLTGRSKFPERVIDLKGKITHVDRSQDDKECNGFKTAIMEHHFLQRCDVALFTPSGYGRTAAILRKTSQNMFCLLPVGVGMCSKANVFTVLNS